MTHSVELLHASVNGMHLVIATDLTVRAGARTRGRERSGWNWRGCRPWWEWVMG